MKFILIVCALLVALLYEKVWRRIKCKEKIIAHISELGGETINIEKVTSRNEIYVVYYIIDGTQKQSTVEFSFIYTESWY